MCNNIKSGFLLTVYFLSVPLFTSQIQSYTYTITNDAWQRLNLRINISGDFHELTLNTYETASVKGRFPLLCLTSIAYKNANGNWQTIQWETTKKLVAVAVGFGGPGCLASGAVAAQRLCRDRSTPQ